MHRRSSLPLLLLLFLALPASAWAEAACPPGNLLEGRAPMQWTQLGSDPRLATDGTVANEGAQWDAPVAAVLDTEASALTYDLGQLTALRAVYVQADANDSYRLLGSVDGKDYQLLGEIGLVEGHGLRSRTLMFEGVSLRYLRFGEGSGDAYYSVSELAAYCQVPDPFPPAFRVGSAPPAKAAKSIYDVWNNRTSIRWELALAGFALGFLLWRLAAKTESRRRSDRWLATLGILAGLTYFNFGFFHFGNYIHNWDAFHYYVGAKYFRELGYESLYECTAIADAESGLRSRVERRRLTNLRSNVIESSKDILAHPERCKDHFTRERWASFKHDVAFFRSREGMRRWDDMMTDHGFNATPVWSIAGSALANLAPASYAQILTLTSLDLLYWLATCAVIAWAFGWRVLCLALLVFATFFPARFYWTGGSFLRWDWLFYMVAAIACLKKDKPVLGGMALGYAMLLRIFPGALFAGPFLLVCVRWIREGKLDRSSLHFLMGGALAMALLMPLGMFSAGKVDTYQAFVRNSLKHAETPLTNNMGLRTVLSHRPGNAGRDLRDSALLDPWQKWKEARLASFDEAKPIFVLLLFGFMALLWRALRNAEPWAAAALAASLIAVLFELTSYYYAFILALALLAAKHERYAAWLLGLTTASCLVAVAPLPFMPTWEDEHYLWISLLSLLVFAAMLWDFGQSRVPGALAATLAAQQTLPALEQKTKKKRARRRTRPGNRRRR
jgi:hypothetical protein